MSLYTHCKSWSKLPKAGGIEDQDYFTMLAFGAIEQGTAARQTLDQALKQQKEQQ